MNPTVQIVPLSAEQFDLRIPMWGEHLEATQYQVGVLQLFLEPQEPDYVTKRYAFKRAETAEFIRACIDRGLLLEARPDGKPIFPQVTRPGAPMFGAPRFDPQQPAAFVFLGVPFDRNTTGLPGARFGPEGIRRTAEPIHYTLDPVTLRPNGFFDYGSGTKMLEGVTLQDAGDVYFAPGEETDLQIDRVTEVMRTILDSGAIPLTIGGDHSMTYPLLRAFPTEHLGLIHIDAHTDLGDTKPGGLHHGNVMSFVLERLEFVERIVQIGIRGILDASQHAPDERVTVVGMDSLREHGSSWVLDQIPDDMSYYLSLDIDVVDPSFAPSTGTPVAGGVLPHELKSLLRALARRRRLIGCDVMEVCMPQGPVDPTPQIALESLLVVADGMVQKIHDGLELSDNEGRDG